MLNGSNWIKPLVLALGLFSSTAIAHVHLAQTVPPRESEVSMAPDKLSLTFSAEVRLIKLVLTNSQGTAIDFGFKPVVKAAKNVSFPVPALPADEYDVEWTVMGNDGHKMEDSYSFTILSGHSHHAGH